MKPFLSSSLLAQHQFPTVALNGHSAAAPTASGATAAGEPGTVVAQYDKLEDGSFGGRVFAQRRAVVMLKASFHQRWRVSVDGVDARTEIVAPGFVGVAVSGGAHTVHFWYASYPRYDLLFALSAVSIIGLVLVRRRFAGRGK